MNRKWIPLAVSVVSLALLIVSAVNIVLILRAADELDAQRVRSESAFTTAIARIPTAAPIPTASGTMPPIPIATLGAPTPIAEAYQVGPIDFSDNGQPITIQIGEGDNAIFIPAFAPYTWTDQAETDTDLFDAANNSGLAWKPDSLNMGLWLHSGTVSGVGLTMYNFELAVETDSAGNRHSPAGIEGALDGLIRGQRATVVQGTVVAVFDIVGAARISPDLVAESQEYLTDDASGWLNANVPDFNTAVLAASDTFFIRTCGRQAVGETYYDSRPYWQQSRFLIGFRFVTAFDLEN